MADPSPLSASAGLGIKAQIVPPQPASKDPKAWAAAQDFEAVLLGQVTQLILQTSPSKGSFSGGYAEETWRSVLAEHIGKDIARHGGIGIASSVYAEIIRLQSTNGGAPVALPQQSSSLAADTALSNPGAHP